jgi:mono/diheme cytochrome c family protein
MLAPKLSTRKLMVAFCAFALAATISTAQYMPLQGPKDAGGYRAPTTQLEQGRKIFVESSCHFCHGVDLTQTSMGSADLLHSPIVGADEDGNLIGPIVKAGLPNLQTSMPSFYDLSDQDIMYLARYVHYLRQQGRYKELMAADLSVGNAEAGKTYFNGSGGCSKCHSPTGDLTGIASRYDAKTLRARFLMPNGTARKDGIALSAAAQLHLRLLENYDPSDVANALAYLSQLR